VFLAGTYDGKVEKSTSIANSMPQWITLRALGQTIKNYELEPADTWWISGNPCHCTLDRPKTLVGSAQGSCWRTSGFM